MAKEADTTGLYTTPFRPGVVQEQVWRPGCEQDDRERCLYYMWEGVLLENGTRRKDRIDGLKLLPMR